MSEIKWASTFIQSVREQSRGSEEQQTVAGDFASFICRVTHLEKQLRLESGSVFFDSESEVFGQLVTVGDGASFRVQRAEWKTNNSSEARRWGKYVALKAVIPKKHDVAVSTESRAPMDWTDILLEVRALLHEPLRFHPNIVRLIGFGWGPTGDSNSVYPQLVLEFSEIGTMENFQMSSDPLPFPIKQKLCYDVCRGLSILHACGIVHGDLKHKNVLIYHSRIETPGLPFTAKLCDFGGSVMDLQSRNRVRMTTWPYGAPELGQVLSSDEVRNTDVYSLGLFIWRTVIDGGNISEAAGLKPEQTPGTEEEMSLLKSCGELLPVAKQSICKYACETNLTKASVALVLYCLEHSIKLPSVDRSLAKVQCALRGIQLAEIPSFLEQVNEKNRQAEEGIKSRAPGRHGLTQIGLLSFLGRSGNDIDMQENTPGFRPRLDHPNVGEFRFEPLKLKMLLTWPQQQFVINDLERAASLPIKDANKDLQPWMAAFYLFQCYLTELGVLFDAQKACYWLSKAAEPESVGGVNYLAQAWLWRISNAFSIECPASANEKEFYITWGIAHGHRTCIEDGKKILNSISNSEGRSSWNAIVRKGTWILNSMTGGVGMPWFAPWKLRRPYQLDDLVLLDSQIQEQLGGDYESNLRQINSVELTANNLKSINGIYVNHVGHTLLHLAAGLGNLKALQYLLQKYIMDINVKDQTSYETPLICACRCAHFDCAMFLIDSGANPNSTQFGAESPLFWLSSFDNDQIQILGQKLVEAGAVVDQGTSPMRGDIRAIWADWEDLWSVPTTPLGRAVIMNSLPAAKTLLSLGADPSAIPDRRESRDGKRAVDLAAVLTLPEMLECFLAILDTKPEIQAQIFDEEGMLHAAHAKSVLPVDTTTLQSRLVRCGAGYETSMFRTLEILRKNKIKHSARWFKTLFERHEPSSDGSALCAEVKLGNLDIARSLVSLGHDANGSPKHRPLEEAVKLNHEPIFKFLVDHGAKINSRRHLENGNELSLLQISADRPKTSRSGIVIAVDLINGGVLIDSEPDGSRSALALAVLSHNFEMANLLLSKGANVNATYQVEAGGPWVTLLAELAATHTEMNVRSIEYLLNSSFTPAVDSDSTTVAGITEQIEDITLWSHTLIKQPDSLHAKPNFIVVGTLGLSVHHILAFNPPEKMIDTAQISSRIIHSILNAYARDEEINYIHPTYGTPLCVATMMGNLHVVRALLDRKASRSLAASPDIFKHFERTHLGEVVEPATPIGLAMSVIQRDYEAILKANGAQEAYDIGLKLKNVLTIAMLLSEGVPEGKNGAPIISLPTTDKIQEMIKLNESNLKIGRAREMERLAGIGNEPVDLSVLKDREG